MPVNGGVRHRNAEHPVACIQTTGYKFVFNRFGGNRLWLAVSAPRLPVLCFHMPSACIFQFHARHRHSTCTHDNTAVHSGSFPPALSIYRPLHRNNLRMGAFCLSDRLGILRIAYGGLLHDYASGTASRRKTQGSIRSYFMQKQKRALPFAGKY